MNHLHAKDVDRVLKESVVLQIIGDGSRLEARDDGYNFRRVHRRRSDEINAIEDNHQTWQSLSSQRGCWSEKVDKILPTEDNRAHRLRLLCSSLSFYYNLQVFHFVFAKTKMTIEALKIRQWRLP